MPNTVKYLRSHRIQGLIIIVIIGLIVVATYMLQKPPENPPAPKIKYVLTVNVVPANGGTTDPQGITEYDNGTAVILTANASGGYCFDYWSVDEQKVGSSVPSVFLEENQVLVIMNENHTATAYFVKIETITFNFSGILNQNVIQILTVDNQPHCTNEFPLNFTWRVGENHSFAWTSELFINETMRGRWMETQGLTTAREGNITVAEGGGQVTSVFSILFKITASSEPEGAGSITPEGNTFWVMKDDNITFTATASDYYEFSRWLLNGEFASENPLHLTADASYDLKAEFHKIEFATTFQVEGLDAEATGFVLQVDEQFFVLTDLPKTLCFQKNTTHSYQYFQAVNSTIVGKAFNLSSIAGVESPLVADEPTEIVATYTTIFQMNLSKTPVEGGTLFPEAGAQWYLTGTMVYLIATPNEKYTFGYWLINDELRGTAPEINITLDAPKNVRAIFLKMQPYLITGVAGVGVTLINPENMTAYNITFDLLQSAKYFFASNENTLYVGVNTPETEIYAIDMMNGSIRMYQFPETHLNRLVQHGNCIYLLLFNHTTTSTTIIKMNSGTFEELAAITLPPAAGSAYATAISDQQVYVVTYNVVDDQGYIFAFDGELHPIANATIPASAPINVAISDYIFIRASDTVVVFDKNLTLVHQITGVLGFGDVAVGEGALYATGYDLSGCACLYSISLTRFVITNTKTLSNTSSVCYRVLYAEGAVYVAMWDSATGSAIVKIKGEETIKLPLQNVQGNSFTDMFYFFADVRSFAF